MGKESFVNEMLSICLLVSEGANRVRMRWCMAAERLISIALCS